MILNNFYFNSLKISKNFIFPSKKFLRVFSSVFKKFFMVLGFFLKAVRTRSMPFKGVFFNG